MLELDIHLSRDERLVVMHDATVDRTTDGSGKVADMGLEELKALEAGAWFHARFAGERVPTLEEVIEATRDAALLNVEIKKGDDLYPGIVMLLARVLEQTDMVDHVVVSSFHPDYLRELKRVLPKVQAALLYHKEVADPVQLAIDEGWEALHPHISRIDPDFLTKAHAKGLRVRAWNPNDAPTMRQLVAMGVDGVGTDYPEVLLAIAQEAGRMSRP